MASAEVVHWDWKEQPDLDKLSEVVRRVSGGACDLREADTGGDFYAVVIADHLIDPAEAQNLFEREYYGDSGD
jgi:hypothetical protein